MKTVFLDALTLGDVDFERFKEFGEVRVYKTTPKGEIVKRLTNSP